MTLEFVIGPSIAPFVVAALLDYVTCPKCGLPTDDVAPDTRFHARTPAWPCRPCRARYQRGREVKRHCSVWRCLKPARYRKRTCVEHGRFG